MTPTREDFQAVAEWLGLPLSCSPEGIPFTPSYEDPDGQVWQPHLPGADCFALMAAMSMDIMFDSAEVGARVDSSEDDHGIWIEHTNIPESKAAALADAVWQCAVRVAMEAKR